MYIIHYNMKRKTINHEYEVNKSYFYSFI